MVAFLQDKDSSGRTSSTAMVDPLALYKVVSIQRNTGGQIYTLPNLHSSLHFSVTDDIAQEIIFRLHFLRGSDHPLDSKFIESNVNFHEDECFVFNRNATQFGGNEACSDCFPNSEDVFEAITNRAMKSCQEGLLDNLNLSADSTRKSPSFSFGWTKSDPKKYASSRCNGAGNVESTLSHAAIDHLSYNGRLALVKAYDIGIKACPDGHNTFTIPHGQKKRIQQRQRLNKKLFRITWQDGLDRPLTSTSFLSCEAMTVLIPTILGNHKDKLNDSMKEMSRAVQINVSLPVNGTYAEGSHMRNWLIEQGYSEEFPVTMIGYSRMVCNRDCQLEKRVSEFAESTERIAGYDVGPLRKVISYALNDSQSFRDYQGTYEKDRHTKSSFIGAAVEEHVREQQSFLQSLRTNPHLFLKQYFNKFAMSESKAIYAKLSTRFYELFELRILKPVCSQSDDGEEIRGSHDFVINNGDTRIQEYRDFMNQMEEVIGDRFDFQNLPKEERVSSKTAHTDWRQLVLERFHRAMNFRTSLESYLLAIVDCKEIPACLLECGMEHVRLNPCYKFEYSKDFNEDNCDHIPSMKNTFNGPTIRLPAAWDKEVCKYILCVDILIMAYFFTEQSILHSQYFVI